MSRSDDYFDDMRTRRDEERFEALLAGREAPDGDAAHLRALVDEVRAQTAGPIPRPSEALAAVLAQGVADDLPEVGGFPAGAGASRRPARSRRIAMVTKPARTLAAKVAGLSLAAQLALGAGVAVAGVGAAGAAGLLPPGPPEVQFAGSGSETFTMEPETGTVGEDFGKRVSDDARGLDGTPGVDGRQISDEAKARFKPDHGEDGGEQVEPNGPPAASDADPASARSGPPANPGGGAGRGGDR